jgi:trimeric autotransporter adhesin
MKKGLLSLLTLTLLTLTLAVTTALAVPSNTPLATAVVPNSAVKAAVVDPATGITYLAGGFTFLGPYTGGGVPVDTSTGSAAATFPKVNGSIYAVTADGLGGWYIGGSFTTVNGVTRTRLAHINADGTLDSWAPSASATVYALVVSGSTVYAGGSFTTINGGTRNRLAAIGTDGTLGTWNPNANNTVKTIVVDGAMVYVGGSFTTIGGTSRPRLAAIGTDGTLGDWNPSTDGDVNAMIMTGSTFYIGGAFTTISSSNRVRLAAIGTDGTVGAWNYKADGAVNALAISGSTVYIGGAFGYITPNGLSATARNRLAAVDTSNGIIQSWNPNADGAVYALLLNGATLYAGGDFTTIGSTARSRLAAIGTDGTLGSWNPRAGGRVNTLAISGSTLYVGGVFNSVGGEVRNMLAAVASDGTLTTWNPNVGGSSPAVNTLALAGSTLYVGGTFTTVNGTGRNNLAAVGTDGALASWNPNAGNTVSALAVSGSTVYAGGTFTTMGGTTRNRLAAIGTDGTLASWDPNAGNAVNALAVSGSTVYAGGTFTTMGGTTRNRLAAIGTDGTLASWNPGANSTVNALTASGTTVYAGGTFTTIGGVSRTSVAAIGTDGTLAGWAPTVTGSGVYTLTMSGSTLYIGGYLTAVNGVTRNTMASVETDGTLNSWNPDGVASYTTSAIATNPSTGQVVAGGSFLTIGGAPRPYLALFNPLSATTTGLVAAPNPVTVGNSVTLTATVSPATATGTVTFKEGATTLGSGDLTGGSATYSTTSFTAGNHSLTASYGGDISNGGSTSSPYDLTVSNAAASVSVASSLNPSAYGQNVTFTATVSPNGLTGTVDFKDNGVAVAGCTGVTLSNDQAVCQISTLGIGNLPITAVYSGNGSYGLATGTLTGGQAVNKADQTITFGTVPDKSFGDADFTVSATGGASGNPVTFASQTASVCTTNGVTVQIVTIGTCIIRASQSGDSNYNAATAVDRSFTVNKATATCNVIGWSGTYDTAAHSASGSCTGIGGVPLTGLSPGSNFTNVPGGTANWSFTNANYADQSGSVNIAITRATPGCTVTPYNVTYDATPHIAAGSCTGIGGTSLAGLNLTGTTHVNAGTYGNDAWSFTDSTGNYNNANGTVNDVIAKAIPTATLNVTNSPVTYDGSPHAATVGISVSSVPGAVSAILTGGAASQTAVGAYPVTATFTPNDTANYSALTGLSAGNFIIVTPITANITVASTPAGRTITVDGTDYTAPRTFTWTIGSSHTVSTTSPQAGGPGTRYSFTSWSDSGSRSHSITVPATAATYTATFGTEYQLTTAANPAVSGYVLPPSGSWYAAGSTVIVSVTPNGGNAFTSWSGPVANANSSATTVAMTGPESITANLSGIPALTAKITNKVGAINSRLWTVTLTNSGTGTATNVTVTGVTITLGPGTTCTPVVKSSFPAPVADVAPGSPQGTTFTLDFTGCATTNKFNARINYSYRDSGAGTYSGVDNFYNMLR